MKLKDFLDKNNISYKSAAENMGLHYSNIYPLLDGLALKNNELKKTVNELLSEMNGKYKLVKFKQAEDGSVVIKISLLPIESMDKKKKETIDWINELAGKSSAGEIALKAGVSISNVCSIASRAGISLKVR